MSKMKQLKLEIEKALFEPPEVSQMLSELRMENLHLRQSKGDIKMFKNINPALIEKIWKTVKISKLVNSNLKVLGGLGISSRELNSQVRGLVRSMTENTSGGLTNPIEGFVGEGFLEIEIFKKGKTIQN